MSQAMSITQLCNNDENNKNQTEKKSKETMNNKRLVIHLYPY